MRIQISFWIVTCLSTKASAFCSYMYLRVDTCWHALLLIAIAFSFISVATGKRSKTSSPFRRPATDSTDAYYTTPHESRSHPHCEKKNHCINKIIQSGKCSSRYCKESSHAWHGRIGCKEGEIMKTGSQTIGRTSDYSMDLTSQSKHIDLYKKFSRLKANASHVK